MGFKILAVTSCPTGIAHTYMAAEGIEKAAKEKDCFVKIETRGSGGEDVYKRQILKSSIKVSVTFGVSDTFKVAVFPASTFKAVSYTHLDVYKRQVS